MIHTHIYTIKNTHTNTHTSFNVYTREVKLHFYIKVPYEEMLKQLLFFKKKYIPMVEITLAANYINSKISQTQCSCFKSIKSER